jgi:hypothetical protein
MNRFSPLMLLTLSLFAAPALAAVDVQRDVTMTDANGGTLVLTTQGRLEVGGSESQTTAVFTDFQPDADGRKVNGEMVRNRYRETDAVVTSFDGLIESEVTGASGEPVVNTLLIENLQVRRDGDGPEFSGQVSWNGETLDAADLPERARYVLRRALRFFKNA